jgi:hypothetical protein
MLARTASAGKPERPDGQQAGAEDAMTGACKLTAHDRLRERLTELRDDALGRMLRRGGGRAQTPAAHRRHQRHARRNR